MDMSVRDQSVDTVVPLAAERVCPRCGKDLVDPAGLGWCSGCGYCRSLEDTAAKKLVEEDSVALRPQIVVAAETGKVIQQLPLWFWVTALIIAQGVFLCVTANRELPPGANLTRALWTTSLIVVGVFLVFIAQCWVLLQIAPEEPSLSFKDALIPFRLWTFAFKRLPNHQTSLWAAALGLTLIVGAVAKIGGLQHWFVYLPANAEAAREREAREPAAPVPYVHQVD